MNLKIIRNQIQEGISRQFNDILKNLEVRIIELLGDASNSQEIIKSIKDCSTETQTVITKISRWFKRSKVEASDFQLENLIDMVMEYSNKSYRHKKIVLERDLNFNKKIKGEYLTHFADLLRIFLENILKHSSDKVSSIKSKITTRITDTNFLELIIENDITNKSSLEVLKDLWKGNKIDTSKLIDEGKSGYHKAYKILTSDLKNNKKNCLKTDFSESEDKFYVIISINLKGLLV